MGLIKTTKQSNDSYLLEITYGGSEAPFGGIDTSAAPAYIDPKCFTAADGFIVVDNKPVAISITQLQNPIIWGGASGIRLIGAGTFYNSTFNQLNYALGYTTTPFGILGTTPTGVSYTFYMTSWDPSDPTVVHDDILSYSLYDSSLFPETAMATIPCLSTGGEVSGAGAGAIVNITAIVTGAFGPGSISTYTAVGGSGYIAGQLVLLLQSGIYHSGNIIIDTVDGLGGILTSHLGAIGFGYSVGSAQAVSNTGTTIELTIDGLNGTNSYNFLTATLTNYNPAGVVTTMAAAINAGPDPNVIASASPDGLSLVLTAISVGVAGNGISITDSSANLVTTLPPAFYFPCVTASILTEGGVDPIPTPAPRNLNPASIVPVGGTIYIGNVGPVILSYSGPGFLAIATGYTGVKTLAKFAGSLIGLGVVPQLGTLIQNEDMVFIWSAATELTEWSPITSAGLVTGAGFAQLADISDALTGLIVSNNTAFILRQEGLSYATPTYNGISPYAFAHISLGNRGEGAQIPALICQYDGQGIYISNTNVIALNQGPTPIGQKIKNPIFDFLNSLPDPIPFGPLVQAPTLMSSNACSIHAGGTDDVFYFFMLGQDIYICNATNGTWMHVSYSLPTTLSLAEGIMSTLSNSSLQSSQQGFSQSLMTLAEGLYNGATGQYLPPAFYSVIEGFGLANTISNTVPFITFPVEEVLFGRDINIDALYIAITGLVPSLSTITINFFFGQVPFGSLTLGSTDLSITEPRNFQIFPTMTPFSAQNPQLMIQIINSVPGLHNLAFTKIAIFGSFDPNQRPV